MRKGVQLTISVIIIVVILLITMIAIIAFMRYGYQETYSSMLTAIEEVDKGISGTDLLSGSWGGEAFGNP